ncbi:transposase [Massilia sp. TS11]|uniref:transposase n=1 Tax=Massilia sp. TS11 TaxID=2908003 RepID=UPI001EDA0705|nr:transposase [Massilia sp. TS11]MCG2583966.1 transposase [Massilia sp. TS11]
MPRRPRVCIPGLTMHVVQRGNNRQVCFLQDADRRMYLDYLASYSGQLACAVHAYVLMDNHVHLLVTQASESGVSLLMKHLNQRYAQYVNRRYTRTGSLWEGRFHASVTEHDHYVLACHRYIESNPVRAGLVAHPGDFPWSSYHANADGAGKPWLTPHPVMLDLGADVYARRRAYRELFLDSQAHNADEALRKAVQRNLPLETTSAPRGRPPHQKVSRQINGV